MAHTQNKHLCSEFNVFFIWMLFTKCNWVFIDLFYDALLSHSSYKMENLYAASSEHHNPSTSSTPCHSLSTRSASISAKKQKRIPLYQRSVSGEELSI